MLRDLVRVLSAAEKQDTATAKSLLQQAGSIGKASAAGSGQAAGAAEPKASGSKAAAAKATGKKITGGSKDPVASQPSASDSEYTSDEYTYEDESEAAPKLPKAQEQRGIKPQPPARGSDAEEPRHREAQCKHHQPKAKNSASHEPIRKRSKEQSPPHKNGKNDKKPKKDTKDKNDKNDKKPTKDKNDKKPHRAGASRQTDARKERVARAALARSVQQGEAATAALLQLGTHSEPMRRPTDDFPKELQVAYNKKNFKHIEVSKRVTSLLRYGAYRGFRLPAFELVAGEAGFYNISDVADAACVTVQVLDVLTRQARDEHGVSLYDADGDYIAAVKDTGSRAGAAKRSKHR